MYEQYLDETEEIIGKEINEIAKYTIGDDADISESSSSEREEEFGVTVVSENESDLGEIPNPSIKTSSEDEEESDEEQCKQDLLVARRSLSLSYGTRKQIKINNDTSSKKCALLSGGESSDYKVSSDACNNSDLP